MPDKSIHIQSFKFGLDRRREQLASQPGTLVKCENAFINHGGEIEKRKGFFKNQNPFPATTFGLEVTAAGLVTFGSVNSPGTLPLGITYQQLEHENFAQPMTAVRFSCNYLGKAFVIATFSDGVSLCFYNGLLVDQSWAGRVMQAISSNTFLAAQLYQLFLDLGWTNSVLGQNPDGSANSASVIVKSPPGITFTPVITTQTVAGVLGARNLNDTSQQLAGTPNVGAVAAFLVVAGTAGTYTLTAPAHSDGSGTATLCSTVIRGATIGATGIAIAAAVNNNSIVTGYTAVTDNAGNVFIEAPDVWGALANSFVLTITATGDVSWTTATVNGPLAITTKPNPIVDTGHAIPSGYFSIGATSQITGGYPPYILSWAEQFTGGANGISFVAAKVNPATTYFQLNSDAPQVTFSKNLLGPVTIVTGFFKVTVTDSNPLGAVTVSYSFPVTLQNI